MRRSELRRHRHQRTDRREWPTRSVERQSCAFFACRLAAIDFLEETLATRRVLLDIAGEIQAEYRRYRILLDNPKSAIGFIYKC